MDAAYRPIGELLRRVRARWWRLTVFQGTLRAALAASACWPWRLLPPRGPAARFSRLARSVWPRSSSPWPHWSGDSGRLARLRPTHALRGSSKSVNHGSTIGWSAPSISALSRPTASPRSPGSWWPMPAVVHRRSTPGSSYPPQVSGAPGIGPWGLRSFWGPSRFLVERPGVAPSTRCRLRCSRRALRSK